MRPPSTRRDVRHPAVAGSFYPADPSRLRATVDELLATPVRPLPGVAVGPGPGPADRVRGVVVPHAGYVYSGPTAATAYRHVVGTSPQRVVLLGPSHFVPLLGLAGAPWASFATPLGLVDTPSPDTVGADAGRAIVSSATVHRREHSLEVQIPFLQRALEGSWSLIPVCVGESEAGLAADAVASLVDENTLLVVSTDLSHYETLDTARRLDSRTAQAIVSRDVDGIGRDDACGRWPLRAALHLATQLGWQVHLLDLRTSGDTAGDPDRVVGYGAFVFTSPSG
jgi:AmmeMemoRadiSam system protein B